jgi:hypothetical protein
MTEDGGGGSLVLQFSPSGGPVTGTLEYRGRTTWQPNPAVNQFYWVNQTVTFAIRGTLAGNALNGTASGTSRYDNPNVPSKSFSLSIEGTVDFANGTARGTMGRNAQSTWKVAFAVAPKPDFQWQPAVVKPGDMVRFTDVTRDPAGGVLQQNWFVDGAPAGTGQTLNWKCPDAQRHAIRLVVTNAQKQQAEVTKSIEPIQITGTVRRTGSGSPVPLAGVVVHARLAEKEQVTATTDAQGVFKLPLPKQISGAFRIELTGLDLPPQGGLPWLQVATAYPLRMSQTIDPNRPVSLTIDVPTGTLVFKVVAEAPSAPPKSAMVKVHGSKGRELAAGRIDANGVATYGFFARRGSDLDVLRPSGQGALDLAELPIQVQAGFEVDGEKIFMESIYQVPAPGPGERLERELPVINPLVELEAIRERIKDCIRSALGNTVDAWQLADRIAKTPIQQNAGSGPQYLERTKVIQLPKSLGQAVANSSAREDLYHEFFHAFQAEALKDSRWSVWFGSGGAHELGKPAATDYVAFDEGRAHFFSNLMQTVAKNKSPVPANQANPNRLQRSENPANYDPGFLQSLPKTENAPGSRIENVITGFLLEHYGPKAAKDPDAVLKDFYQTSDKYRQKHGDPPATIQEFIEAKREQGDPAAATSRPGEISSLDRLAAKYSIWNGQNMLLQTPTVTPEQLKIMQQNQGWDRELEIGPSPGGARLTVKPTAKSVTLTLPMSSSSLKGPTLQLAPNTAVNLDPHGAELRAAPDPLTSQKLVVDTGSAAGYSVRYKDLIAIPDMTRYAVELHPGGIFQLNVIEGKVRLADSVAGISRMVSAGESVRWREGALPEAPVRIGNPGAQMWWPAQLETGTPVAGETPANPAGIPSPPDAEGAVVLGVMAILGGGACLLSMLLVLIFVIVRAVSGRPKTQPAQGMIPPPGSALPRAQQPGPGTPAQGAGFCMHCGSSLVQGARFCSRCGNQVTG